MAAQTEEQANTGRLEGIRCPQCGSYEPFFIGPIKATLKVCDDSIEEYDAEWNNESDIACDECDHIGIVDDFSHGLESELPYAVGRTDRDGIMGRFATEREASEYIVRFGDPADVASGLYFLDGPEAPLKVKAEVHTNDYAFAYDFDAAPWFAQATAKDIVALGNCGWGGDYPADAVASFFRLSDDRLALLFRYVESNAAGAGFECHVNGDEAMAWLVKYRPEVHEVIKREEANNG